jgi:hypothetical protein
MSSSSALTGSGPASSSGSSEEASLVQALAAASHEFDATGADPERNCWLAVHRHVHGVLPNEYDIREVPEELYLAVLAVRRQQP